MTNDGGLDRFRDFAANTISAKQGLSGDVAQAVLGARDGSVWIGTENGLEQWKDGHTTIYGERSGGLPDQYVDSIFQDGHGWIWVFTVRGAAYLKGGQFVPIAGVPGGYVRDVGEDAPGSLWVSLDQGLLHLVDGRVVERIPWSRPGHKDYAYSLRPDPARGGLWLGFSQGGLAFFKDSDVRASYSASDGLGKGMVGRFQIDGDGTLWAATEGGLSRLRNGRIATLTSANGLPCDAVRRVIEDDDHAIWLGTSCGLARIARTELDAWANDSKRTVRVTVLDRSDGVIGPPLGGRVAKSTDGKLWFGAPGAVAVIDPWHLPLNKLPPPVVVERVVADRTAYGVTSGLRLPPLSRDLEIDYTALSLVAPEKNRFRVKLEGWDRDWKDAGNKREAFYGNLPPRSYRFRVMASNNSGVWNEAGDWFDFSIAPEYYQTRWFEAAWAAAFLALLWGVYRYRLHQIAREFNVRLEERVDERTRIARELHDTLLQSFQGMMLRFQVGTDLLPPGKAKDTLEQALERGDQAIAEGREAIHDLRSSQEITNDLARAMAAVGEEASAASGSNPPEFRVVVEGASRELHPILRDEIYRIVREAVRNAFRHAQARRIEAEIEYREGLLKVRIRDDGRGMDPEIVKQGRSGHYGVPGMRERARRMGGKLEVWTGIGAGTEIEPRDEIRRFPTEVRSRVGGGLFRLQIGETLGMHVARPMPMVAPGVSELRVKGEDGIFRVFYFTAGVKGVLVFHAFAKKTQRTPPLEIELAKKRLKELLDV